MIWWARNTLRCHLNAGTHKKNIGHPPLFSPEQKTGSCDRIFRLAEVGVPIIFKLLRKIFCMYYELNGIMNNFNENSGLGGRKQNKLFLGRHPDVSKIQAKEDH
jgi:hypothetical protein